MIDALDGDGQGSVFCDDNETLFLQIPLMELKTLVRAIQHFLNIKSHYTSVLSLLSSSFVEQHKDFCMIVRVIYS